jgi:hypothetical protein
MANYSSYVTIQVSKLVPQLSLLSSNADQGSYVFPPPQIIAPGTTGNFDLQDPSGPAGSSGSANYGGQNVSLSLGYACPYWSSNSGSVDGGGPGFAIDWYAQTSNSGTWSNGQIPGSGHPLQLFVAIRAASEPVVPPPSS